MIKIFLCLLLVSLSISVSSQQTEPKQQLTKQDYLKKSKNQKTAAWVLLGSGTVMSVGAMFWAANNLFGPDQGEGVLFFTGIGAMLGSIPLFIASGRNKTKAYEPGARINLKFERSFVMKNQIPGNNYYPAISLNILIR